MDDGSLYRIISSAIIIAQMPLPVFLFPAVSTTELNLRCYTCCTDGRDGGRGESKHWLLQLIQAFTLVGIGL